MKLIVTDRQTIERGLPVKAGTYAVISIRDPDKRRVRVPKTTALRGVLELAFHDAEPVPGRQLPPGMRPMSPDDATAVAEFVMHHRDRVKALVIHCEQGMSRSPAVAAAVADYLGQGVSTCWTRYIPNRYVYRLLAETLAGAAHVPASRKARAT